LNTSAEIPIVAENESTTLPISSRGATIERSNTISTIRMTSSTTGMIRLRSCTAAAFVSIAVAVVPPTMAWPLLATLVRSLSTTFCAATESGSFASVACSSTLPA
jgi:hypothetical protein